MRRHEMRTRGGKLWEGEASAWGVRACVLRHGHGWGARMRARVLGEGRALGSWGPPRSASAVAGAAKQSSAHGRVLMSSHRCAFS